MPTGTYAVTGTADIGATSSTSYVVTQQVGTVYVAGDNRGGKVGNGTISLTEATPVSTPMPSIGMSNAVGVSEGAQDTCALKTEPICLVLGNQLLW